MKNLLRHSSLKALVIASLILPLTSCFSYRPIFDNNEKFRSAGEEQANADFKVCKKEADDYLDKYKAERAAKQAARNAVIGGVVGTAVGVIFGGGVRSVLGSAAIGAGVGGVAGALSVAGEDKVTPDQMKQRYIIRCLGNKGYSVIGWI